MTGSPGMVGVTVVCGPRDTCAAVLGWWEVPVVCGPRDTCAAVLGWWELLWCVAPETHEWQSWDGGSYCG